MISTGDPGGSRRAGSVCPGPILFYTGNESPVTDYWKASGLITQVLAPRLGGLLIFAEHRYFGESLPFGNVTSFQNGKINYLSPEQALADYAHFLHRFKTVLRPEAQECPVVAFGGSYGGMLTAWFRMKYPNVVIGGLASSAALAFDGTGVSFYAFFDAAQRAYGLAVPGCDALMGKAIRELVELSSSGWMGQGSAAFSFARR